MTNLEPNSTTTLNPRLVIYFSNEEKQCNGICHFFKKGSFTCQCKELEMIVLGNKNRSYIFFNQGKIIATLPEYKKKKETKQSLKPDTQRTNRNNET